jgi:hypothetical protein
MSLTSAAPKPAATSKSRETIGPWTAHQCVQRCKLRAGETLCGVASAQFACGRAECEIFEAHVGHAVLAPPAWLLPAHARAALQHKWFGEVVIGPKVETAHNIRHRVSAVTMMARSIETPCPEFPKHTESVHARHPVCV